MDRRTPVRGWKATLHVRHEALQVAVIAPALAQGPVKPQSKFVKNLEETQTVGSLPQISVPDIALSADDDESHHRILRGKQIRFHVLIPVVVKQVERSHQLKPLWGLGNMDW